MTLTAGKTAPPTTGKITINAMSGGITHTATVGVSVMPILKGTVPVDLASSYNVTGMYKKGSTFEPAASVDAEGNAFAAEALGPETIGEEVAFKLGPVGAPDAVTGRTIPFPSGEFGSIRLLATAVEGTQTAQHFTVNYTDGTSASFTQGLSDWSGAASQPGESQAVEMPYRLTGDGSVDGNPFSLFAYRFQLDPNKGVRSLTLPANRNVIVFGVTLVPPGKEVSTGSEQAQR